ncbi:Zn-dependent alcohol dehydrogenase [Terriglobus roseus DSM 18391]|uniref:Zn-dependent alcohol dehydrogenase n=1 Tax=Terriglobus roseus (strain DSM 18391 / NRRL B-41598 / KBS 63) TaxID=926566 RepID=I3ZCY1_TERRK|nr:NAD(P)-dependent alcohol dehydrogenase [Terriglobus roseus]AFL87099.1 Zn-dependent alcohol dehydrogenase [Terriglobus roseus DSM 18391]
MPQASGYAAQSAKAPLAPFSFERREPREHDVNIDIKFCGICHSDVHQARDEWGGSIFPMVPGHEIAGIVTSVGSGVTKFKVGDKVGVGCFVDSCRQCAECVKGEDNYCLVGMNATYNGREKDGTPTYGGYSDHIVVDENYVLSIPDNLPLDAAAPLLCAGITLYSPLKHWNAGPGKKVGIVGLGGLGHMGVKLSHALGAQTIVLSQSMKKAEDAKRLGADEFYAMSDPETAKKLAGTFDLIISTVGVAMDFGPYLAMLKKDGAMVLVGAPEDNSTLNSFSLIVGRKTLGGSMIGSIKETQEMLDFCGEKNIVSDIEITPIDKVNEAYERMLKSDVRYRFVIDLSTLKA